MILDLRGLTFIDVTGVHLIVEASLRAALFGGRLIVVRGPAQVQRLLERPGMGDGVEMVDFPLAAARRPNESLATP